jgi:hypothetical protein
MKRFLRILPLVLVVLLLASCDLQAMGDDILGTMPPESQALPAITEELIVPEVVDPNLEPVEEEQPAEPPPPTAVPIPELGEKQVIPDGGFSFRKLAGYDLKINRESVEMFNPDSTLILSLYGVRNYYGNEAHEQIINEFLDTLVNRGVANFSKSAPFGVTIGGVQGTAFGLTGTMYGAPIEGLAFVVMPDPTRFLYGMAASNIKKDPDLWKKEGNLAFSTLVSSIQFLNGGNYGSNACPVSGDTTYGYWKDNPVRLGGGEAQAEAREQAYLNALSGPNGEKVNYTRLGSSVYNGAVISEYTVSFEGITAPVTLYLDVSNYADPIAPYGFTCWMTIPLSAP